VEDAEACDVESLEEYLRYTRIRIARETWGYGEEDGAFILSPSKLEVVEEDVFPSCRLAMNSLGICEQMYQTASACVQSRTSPSANGHDIKIS
jgi:hypothetical protein